MDVPEGTGPLTPAERRAYVLGRRRFERGDVDGALVQFHRLLRTRSGFADVHYMVGALHEQKNDLESAAVSLREAVRLNPGYAEAALALASICERQGDFAQSREIAERAFEHTRPAAGADGADTEARGRNALDATTRGKLANLYAQVADACREAGEIGEAIAAYRKALDHGPAFHDIRYRLGATLREAGLPDRALAEFRRVLRGNPNLLEAAVQMGLTLYSLGRTREAVAQWNAVLTRDPGRRDAQMYLRLVGAGKADPSSDP